MSKSEIEELPEELRKILLAYITPLNKAISELLHTRSEEDFEGNFKNVMFEFLDSYTSAILAMKEEHLDLLLKNYWTFTSQVTAQAHSPLTQALADANRVIANFIGLMLDPTYRDYLPNHPGVFKPYMELLVCTAILIYTIDNIPETEVEPSMAKKIITRSQKTTWKVEDYVDTIEIDADHEASAALERVKQTPF
jgi:hypothetical protein